METCPSGVTWAIGNDRTPWVYTGAFGGGFFKGEQILHTNVAKSNDEVQNRFQCELILVSISGMASSSNGIFTQTDKCDFYIYENQRWRPVLGYTDKYVGTFVC